MNNVVGQTCPYCQFPINTGDQTVICSKCGLSHHQRCWQENGSCTTFGCDGQPVSPAQASMVFKPSTYVDLTVDEEICSYCGFGNPMSSRFCRKCGQNLTAVTGQTAATSQLTGLTCGKCGAVNSSTAAFCIICGNAFQQQGPPPVHYPASQYSTPQYPQYPQGAAIGTTVPNYLWQAILCTLCCCLPGGIVAIVYASQVNSKLLEGDYAGAIIASNNAKTWCWVSFAVGMLIGFLYFLGIGIAGVATKHH